MSIIYKVHKFDDIVNPLIVHNPLSNIKHLIFSIIETQIFVS